MDLPLRCSCGAWRGVLRSVGPGSGNRCICYCDDCQAFAFYLNRADQILDAHGGTDIFQTTPARLEITSGREQLASMQLRPGARVVRWFARCCRTPIGNTPADRRVPFVGVIHRCMDPAAAGRSADDALGPVRGSAFPDFARGDRAQIPRKLSAIRMARLLAMTAGARLRREQRRSPFGRPQPHVLGADELRAIEAARDAAYV